MNSGEVLAMTHERSSDGSIEFLVRSSQHPDLAITLASREFSASLRAQYCDFSLVCPFVQLILQRRPATLSLDYLCSETADLTRFALALDIKVVVSADAEDVVLGESDADHRWGSALLSSLRKSMDDEKTESPADGGFGYEHYALGSRNHNLLIKWVDRVARWFEDRHKILDVGCSTGVFLDQMVRRGLHAEGIDNNAASIRYAEAMGLNVRCTDVREGLSASNAEYDAIHCAHFVEHLTTAELTECMAAIYRALVPGGRAVFIFPDPESIRSQLLGFWRDPTHVRFYHPDIIESMARAAGLRLEHNSQKEDGRIVVPFSFEPPAYEPFHFDSGDLAAEADSELMRQVKALERRVIIQERWIRQLWAVNQTWAWADDAVLSFRKPH